MGFTIKCDKCGQEQNLESSSKSFWENETIELYTTGHHLDSIEINISCGCGNEVEG